MQQLQLRGLPPGSYGTRRYGLLRLFEPFQGGFSFSQLLARHGKKQPVPNCAVLIPERHRIGGQSGRRSAAGGDIRLTGTFQSSLCLDKISVPVTGRTQSVQEEIVVKLRVGLVVARFVTKASEPWKSTAPKEGETHTKTVGKRSYTWCPHHKYWGGHAAAECFKVNKPTNAPSTAPSQKSNAQKEAVLQLKAAYASLMEDIDNQE